MQRDVDLKWWHDADGQENVSFTTTGAKITFAWTDDAALAQMTNNLDELAEAVRGMMRNEYEVIKFVEEIPDTLGDIDG